MRSMTGYGRGESESGGAKISVEINSVNRRQSDIVINLPRDLSMRTSGIFAPIFSKICCSDTSKCAVTWSNA